MSAPAVGARGHGRFTVTRLHRSGHAPHRILLIGDRATLAPIGVAQTEALAQRLTERVGERTGRGVDTDVVWELAPVLAAIRGGSSSWRLWRYDAMVIVIAFSTAPVFGRRRNRRLAGLLHRIFEQIAASSPVLVVSLHTDGAPHARTSGRGGRVLHLHGDRVPPAEVSVLSVPSGGDADVEAIVQRLTGLLAASDLRSAGPGTDSSHRRRWLPDDEADRQHAVDDLDLPSRKLHHQLQHVVEMARALCDTPMAEIAIIDRDRRWVLASTGEPGSDIPRETSLCNRSIQQRGATVIADTWQVPALRGNPLTDGLEPVRFYASHPIESIDGYRIGTLCVWDDHPRDAEHVDTAALRDLALLAEAEIITADRRR